MTVDGTRSNLPLIPERLKGPLTRLSDLHEERDKLLATLYSEGYNGATLARLFRISHSAVIRKLRKAGVWTSRYDNPPPKSVKEYVKKGVIGDSLIKLHPAIQERLADMAINQGKTLSDIVVALALKQLLKEATDGKTTNAV